MFGSLLRGWPAALLTACAPLALAPDGAGPARCRALVELHEPGVRVVASSWVGAGSTGERAAPQPAGGTFCHVTAWLDERTGVDREHYRTTIELRLPWPGNGRLLQLGSRSDGPPPPTEQRLRDQALGRGFALLSGDLGHGAESAATALFGLDPQARIEAAWRAPWRSAQVGQRLYRAFHGQPAQRRYFAGCGDGGRQGLLFAQRFPDLVDGVIAESPSMRASLGAGIAAAFNVQRWLEVAPAAAGAPAADVHRARAAALRAALSDAQLARVAGAIVERCDEADGLRDGIVADTALCRIDVRRLVCAEPDCLSSKQALALGRVMSGPLSRTGSALYFPWPWDPGIAAPAWRAWSLGTAVADAGTGASADAAATSGVPAAAAALHLTHTAPRIAYVYATPPDATLTLDSFDFERDPLRLQLEHRVHGAADEVLLKGFRERGGRLLLIHGMADPVNSAFETVDYQERVNTALGPTAAARAVRSFLVPGMNHCGGGPATDRYDALSALVEWVEHERAPERIVAGGAAGIGSSGPIERPLCPHPRIARYSGGDIAAASSFVCR